MSGDSDFEEMNGHPAPAVIRRLWNRVETECYYNFDDLPDNYEDYCEVRIMRSNANSAYGYQFNRVYYPGDLRCTLVTAGLLTDLQARICQAVGQEE